MPLIADVTAAKAINTRKFTHGVEEVKQANVSGTEIECSKNFHQGRAERPGSVQVALGVSGHKEKRRLCESVDFLSSG